jgi:hypothetical protein
MQTDMNLPFITADQQDKHLNAKLTRKLKALCADLIGGLKAPADKPLKADSP